jgi:hypothetical protein
MQRYLRDCAVLVPPGRLGADEGTLLIIAVRGMCVSGIAGYNSGDALVSESGFLSRGPIWGSQAQISSGGSGCTWATSGSLGDLRSCCRISATIRAHLYSALELQLDLAEGTSPPRCRIRMLNMPNN